MAGKKKLVIEPKWCKGCGICAAFCPKNALKIENGKVVEIKEAGCILCGLCELRCPDFAIYVDVEE